MHKIKRGYYIDSCDAQTVVGIKTRIQSGFMLKLITLLVLVASMQLTAKGLIQTLQFDANCNASALPFNLMIDDTNGGVDLTNLTNFAKLKKGSNLFTSYVLMEISGDKNEFYKYKERERFSESTNQGSEVGNGSEHVCFSYNNNCIAGLLRVNYWYILRPFKKVCNLILPANYKVCKSVFFYSSYNLLSASNFGLLRLNYKVNKQFRN